MILGQKTRLRPVEKEDLPRFVRWLGDPEVRALIGMHLPISQVQEERWFDRNLGAGNEQTWSIDLQPEMAVGPWQHVGSCGYHKIDWLSRKGEIGIILGAKEFWGKGYGTDAVQTLVAWGFYTLNLNRVELRVFATNARAIRSYEKVGFILEGRQRQAIYKDGAYHDELIMGVLRSDWARAVSDSTADPTD